MNLMNNKAKSDPAELIRDLENCPDWGSRYRKIIALGKELHPLPEESKTEDNQVKGCQSQVWLVPELTEDQRVEFRGDSDALIVKGLVALLLSIYSGKTPAEILATEPEFIERLGLSQHLSMTRSNGLHQMLKQIKFYALAYQTLLHRQQAS